MFPNLIKLFGIAAVVTATGETPDNQKLLTVDVVVPPYLPEFKPPELVSGNVLSSADMKIQQLLTTAPKLTYKEKREQPILETDLANEKGRKQLEMDFNKASLTYDDFIGFLQNNVFDITDLAIPDKWIEIALDKSAQGDLKDIEVLVVRGFSLHSEFFGFAEIKLKLFSPLTYAFAKQAVSTVEYLILKGVNVFYSSDRIKSGDLPLSLSINSFFRTTYQGNKKIFHIIDKAQEKYSKEKIFKNKGYRILENNVGDPLQESIRALDIERYQALLAITGVDAKAADGSTILHQMCDARIPVIFVEVMGKYSHTKLLINRQNNQGQTALHIVVNNKANWLIDALIKQGADLEKIDDKRKAPLMLAVESENYLGMKLLMENGADPERAVKLALEKNDKKALSILRAEYHTVRPDVPYFRWWMAVPGVGALLIVAAFVDRYRLKKSIEKTIQDYFMMKGMLTGYNPIRLQVLIEISDYAYDFKKKPFAENFLNKKLSCFDEDLAQYSARINDNSETTTIPVKVMAKEFKRLFRKIFIKQLDRVQWLNTVRRQQIIDNLAKKGDLYLEFPLSIFDDEKFNFRLFFFKIYFKMIINEFKKQDRDTTEHAKKLIAAFKDEVGLKLNYKIDELGNCVISLPAEICMLKDKQQCILGKRKYLSKFKENFNDRLAVIVKELKSLEDAKALVDGMYVNDSLVISPSVLKKLIEEQKSLSEILTKLNKDFSAIGSWVAVTSQTEDTLEEKYVVGVFRVKSKQKSKLNPDVMLLVDDELEEIILPEEIKSEQKVNNETNEDKQIKRPEKVEAYNQAKQAAIAKNITTKAQKKQEREKNALEKKQLQAASHAIVLTWWNDVFAQVANSKPIQESLALNSADTMAIRFKSALALLFYLQKLVCGLINMKEVGDYRQRDMQKLFDFRTGIVHMLNRFSVDQIISGTKQIFEYLLAQCPGLDDLAKEDNLNKHIDIIEGLVNSWENNPIALAVKQNTQILPEHNPLVNANNADEKITENADNKDSRLYLRWVKEKMLPIMNLLWKSSSEERITLIRRFFAPVPVSSATPSYQLKDEADFAAIITMMSMIGEYYTYDRRGKIGTLNKDLKNFLLRCKVIRNVIAHWGGDWSGHEIIHRQHMITAVFKYQEPAKLFECTIQTGQFIDEEGVKKFAGAPRETSLKEYLVETCQKAAKVTQRVWDKNLFLETSYQLVDTKDSLSMITAEMQDSDPLSSDSDSDTNSIVETQPASSGLSASAKPFFPPGFKL